MFFYSYWPPYSQPWISEPWISQGTRAYEVVPFVEAGGRHSAETRRNRLHQIRRRVGWAVVQIGLWLVARSTDGLPGMPVVPCLKDSRGKMDDTKEG